MGGKIKRIVETSEGPTDTTGMVYYLSFLIKHQDILTLLQHLAKSEYTIFSQRK